MQWLQVTFQVPADFLQRTFAPLPLGTGEIAIEASLECVVVPTRAKVPS